MGTHRDDPTPLRPAERDDADTLVIAEPSLLNDFTLVKNGVLRMRGLSRAARLTYILLISYAWQEGRCFPGLERLRADLSEDGDKLASDNSVRAWLRELEERRLISIRQRGLQQTNIYTILPLDQAEGYASDPPKSPGATPKRGASTPPANIAVPDPTKIAVQENLARSTPPDPTKIAVQEPQFSQVPIKEETDSEVIRPSNRRTVYYEGMRSDEGTDAPGPEEGTDTPLFDEGDAPPQSPPGPAGGMRKAAVRALARQLCATCEVNAEDPDELRAMESVVRSFLGEGPGRVPIEEIEAEASFYRLHFKRNPKKARHSALQFRTWLRTEMDHGRLARYMGPDHHPISGFGGGPPPKRETTPPPGAPRSADRYTSWSYGVCPRCLESPCTCAGSTPRTRPTPSAHQQHPRA